MGLSPLMAIYQARFQRYLENRGMKPATDAKVWAFLGDGETDEPESLGAITLASREKLDNLIFVVNCNLQRLDGPVRATGRSFRNWSRRSAARDGTSSRCCGKRVGSDSGARHGRSARQADGTAGGRRVSEVGGFVGRVCSPTFLWTYPRLLKLVEPLPDEALRRLRLGGHDPKEGVRGI